MSAANYFGYFYLFSWMCCREFYLDQIIKTFGAKESNAVGKAIIRTLHGYLYYRHKFGRYISNTRVAHKLRYSTAIQIYDYWK